MGNSDEISAAGSSDSSCNLCGRKEDIIYEGACESCVNQTLTRLLPRLRRRLEVSFGEMLDDWLTIGHFYKVTWKAKDSFRIKRAGLKGYLQEVVENAIVETEIQLDLDSDELWKPTRIDELMEHIYEQCINELEPLITESIKRALDTAPTEEAEREVIEVVSGRQRVRKRYIRDRVVDTLTSSDKNLIPYEAKVLAALRYRSDRDRELYTEMADGRISSVWREVEDLLPKEIAKLIVDDDSF